MTTSRALEALNSLVELTDRKHTAKALAKIIEAALSAEEIEGDSLIVKPCKYRNLTTPNVQEKDGWEFIAKVGGKEIRGCGNDFTAVIELSVHGVSALKAARQGRGG